MDLVGVITQLKVNFVAVEGRVAGAAEFGASMSGTLMPDAWPSAYVVPLNEDAEPNDVSNALYQIITERIGVVVEFDNSADRRGQSVTQLYANVRASLFAAILNWRGLDPAHAMRGFEAAGGAVLQSDRSRIFYQWEFTFPTVVTDADGWQVNPPALLEIDANTDPGAVTPPIKVQLPQPGQTP